MHDRIKSESAPFSKKRGHLQVIFEVLEVCRLPQNKTRIMQKASLSYSQLIAVLEVLEKYKLLEVKENPGKEYISSAKGKEYAIKYRELQKMAGSSDQEKDNIQKKGCG